LVAFWRTINIQFDAGSRAESSELWDKAQRPGNQRLFAGFSGQEDSGIQLLGAG
jgi:hypothetical protein